MYAVPPLEEPFVKFSIKSFKGFFAITLAQYRCINCSNDLGKDHGLWPLNLAKAIVQDSILNLSMNLLFSI